MIISHQPFTSLLTIALALILPAQIQAQDSESWNDDRVGLFVHWGLYSATEGAWQGNSIPNASEWIQQAANIHSSDYSSTLKQLFEPSTTWATELAQSAKNAGLEYVVITAKHHDGFTLFNSAEYWSTGATSDPAKTSNPYGGTNISPAGRDLMQELVTAVRAEGLKVGFYYSVIDWQHPNAYRGNNGLPKPNVMSNGKYDENSADPDPAAGSYKTYIFNHIEQLLTQYGKIDELWFDYSSAAVDGSDWNADALMAMIRGHQPDIMVNNRLYDGQQNTKGDFGTPERYIPANGLSIDWETAQSWDNSSWGYQSIANGANYKTTREAIQIFAEAASKGGNTLLNVGPDRFGNIPPEQATRMTALGEWMAVNGEAIKSTRASGIDASGLWGRMTKHKSGNRYHAIVFDRPANGIIDITAVTEGKVVSAISATRLTASGPVAAPITITNGSYTLDLDAGDLDAQQSATFRIDLDAVTLPNLALGKTTSSSSVYQSDGLNLHPGLAVDGDRSAVNGNGLNFFHSDSADVDPWFQVDLVENFRIQQIILYNRNGYEGRLRDITVEILDASDNVVATFADLNSGNELSGPSTLKILLQDHELISGKKIRVSRESDPGGGDDNTILCLSEIEVYGYAPADISLNGSVDQADIDMLASNWGTGNSYFTGDINGDGIVDQADLTLVLKNWTGTEKANLAAVPASFIDTDGDKLDDNWEIIQFGNLTVEDHTDNNDGDAYNNLWEIAFGGDPTVAESIAGATDFTYVDTSTAVFQFQRPKNHASTGINYQIKTSITLSAWKNVTSAMPKPSISIDARKEWAVYEIPIAGDRAFFKLEISSQTP